VRFFPARYRDGRSQSSPPLCGHSRYGVGRPDRTLFYGARRLEDIRRTAFWGIAGRGRVRELVVTGPGGLRRTLRPAVTGAFLVVLDPSVDPDALRVEVRFRDGRVLRTGPERDLVDRTEPR
jgi:hypothetical protein